VLCRGRCVAARPLGGETRQGADGKTCVHCLALPFRAGADPRVSTGLALTGKCLRESHANARRHRRSPAPVALLGAAAMPRNFEAKEPRSTGKRGRSLAEQPVEPYRTSRKLRGVTYCLSCAECHAVSDETASAWRGFLTDDEYEPAEVLILCPECAAREFGPWQLRMRTEDDCD
jgi:hypothetical protein